MTLPNIETRKDDIVEDFHGTQVADPYRWLEDPADPEVAAWTAAQNARTRQFIDAIPARSRLQQRLTELWDFPRWSIPTLKGGRAFFSKNDGLQNQAVYYVADDPRDAGRALIDPNTLTADGTIALTSTWPSPDGSLVGYTLAEAGSDWQTIKVRDVASGEDLPDTIQWAKFTGVEWLPDGQSFIYTRFPEPGTVPAEDTNNFNRVHLHRLGENQVDDTLIYERPDNKELHFYPQISHDGRYLIITANIGTDPRTTLYYRELQSDGPLIELIGTADASYQFIDNTGSIFLIQTDLDAPLGRVVAVDTANPGREHWHDLIAEAGDALASVSPVGNVLTVMRLRDAQYQLALHDREGGFVRDIELPAIGSIMALSGEPGDDELFIAFTSFLYPTTPFRLDLTQPDSVLEPLHAAGIDFDPSQYETKQVFYTSKDGTRVPMFITHRNGLALDGNNPTLLYAYGGFNISITPSFATENLVWLENGGVFAVANLRGGSEYGEDWHQAGMLEKKQNVFDDFIAAGEWLIDNGYTSTEKLAINGRSNGGLLTGACLTQRPDLYGAVVCEVPVIDMLRYHLFTVGHFWIPEYGNAVADPAHFTFMYAYSPLHNVREGTEYPATLITSADTDDRVVPAHAKKFAAALQTAQAGDEPILIRIETRAGHGMGKPTSKIIEERADVFAFLFTELKIEG